MGEAALIIVAVILVLAVIAGTMFFIISHKIRQISRSVFGTDSFLEGLQQQEEELSRTPKSVSGMTSLFLPRIEKDFPEFSLPECIQKTERQLRERLEAIEQENLSCLTDASPELSRQVGLHIKENQRQGVRESFHGVKIHQTALSGYERAAGCCTMTLQSAVEYGYRRWKSGEADAGTEETVQTRFQAEWSYTQDEESLPDHVKAVAFNCPNCGAPVKKLGERFCEYCGTAIEAVNLKVWTLDRIEEK